MNEAEKEERIRARAYALWEQQGRPEGRQSENWDQARREIEQEDADGLRSTVTETIGLAVGAEPVEPKPRRRTMPQEEAAQKPSRPGKKAPSGTP